MLIVLVGGTLRRMSSTQLHLGEQLTCYRLAWLPRPVAPSVFEARLFDALDDGRLTQPILVFSTYQQYPKTVKRHEERSLGIMRSERVLRELLEPPRGSVIPALARPNEGYTYNQVTIIPKEETP